MQGRLLAGRLEGAAQRLAVDRHDVGRLLRKRTHELRKTFAERRWIEKPEQPAVGVLRRQSVLQPRKFRKNGSLSSKNFPHIGVCRPLLPRGEKGVLRIGGAQIDQPETI